MTEAATGQIENDDPSLSDTLSAAFDESTNNGAADDNPESAASGSTAPQAQSATSPAQPGAAPLDGVQAAGTLAQQAPIPHAPVGFPDLQKWTQLDDATRQWIRNREGQFHQGITKNAQAAKFGQSMYQTLAPYAAGLQARGIDPLQMIAEWAATEQLLTTGDQRTKHQAFLQAAQRYGINLEELIGQQPEQRQVDPEVAQLKQAVLHMAEMLQGNEQQRGQQEAQQIWSQTDQFARDPQNEFFPQLYERMAQLIERGAAQDYQGAYQTAMWERPDLRAIMQSRDAAKRTEAARAARRSGTGSTGIPVAAGTEPSNDSIRGTLERAFNAAA